MKENIKLFATPADANEYAVKDFPLVAHVESSGQDIVVSEPVFNAGDTALVNTDGVVGAETTEVRNRWCLEDGTIVNGDYSALTAAQRKTCKWCYASVLYENMLKDNTDITFISISNNFFERASETTSASTEQNKSAVRNCTNLKTVLCRCRNVGDDHSTGTHAYTKWGRRLYGITGATLIIGDNVTKIGEMAFRECLRFIKYIIPSTVVEIGDGAFRDNNTVVSVKIANGLKSIGNDAFNGCYNLESINLPVGLESIHSDAFNGCSKLKTIVVPSTVTGIGARAFMSALNVIYHGKATGAPWGAACLNGWEDTDGTIYQDAYKKILKVYNRSASGAITIPSSVEEVGDKAFYDCKSITGITIPSSVKKIGNEAFSLNKSGRPISSLVIPATVETFGSYIGSYCQEVVISKLRNTYAMPEKTNIGCFTIKINDVDSGTFSGDYNVCALFNANYYNNQIYGTVTYNVYTDNQTVHDQLAADTRQGISYNLYHLDGTAWS